MALFPRTRRLDAVEREKIAKLVEAEHEVEDLVARKDLAVRALSERQKRNHWRESIETMIQGAR